MTTQARERWNGPYRYTNMLFAEQNKALALNSPFSPSYQPGAQYMISDRGNVKIWQRPTSQQAA